MMWECEYSREPVDYRLLWLRFLRKIWIVPLAVLAGMALVAGCHFFARTVARGGRTYQTESVFYIDFAENAQGETYDYYNYFTWGEVIHTDFFLDSVYEKMGGRLSREEIASYITASVDSDVRYLYVRCDTHSPALSVELASILEEILPKFADIRKEIRSIETARAGTAARDSSKLRMGNACFLGACLGLGISLFGILISLILDTSVYLPSTVEKRYHVTCLGAPFLPEFAPNWKYFLRDATEIALVSVDEDIREEEILAVEAAAGQPVREVRSERERDTVSLPENDSKSMAICQNPITHPEELDRIRECEAVLLALKAGRRNDKVFERLLEQLGRQDIKVTAVVLVSADEKLLAAYYRNRFSPQ